MTQAAPAMSEALSHETLVDRYARMAHEFEPRAVDRLLRAFDVVLAAAGLVLTSPLMALCALAVRASGSRSVLYRGDRVGRGGAIFTMVKFRTLKPQAEARIGPFYGEELTRLTEGEQTRVGGLLRASKLDELPQLWNVLRGEMSLVGPRPFVVHESEQITGWASRRLETTPGITGLWQILGRNDIPFEEMVKLDYVYVTNWSLWWDIKILVQTLPVVLARRGAY